jgi:hypothetical protein
MPPEDLYLHATINRHRAPDDARLPNLPLRTWQYAPYLESVTLSGSQAKSTALRDSDLDFFLALSPQTPGELAAIQQSLATHLHAQIRNVSVRIILNNVSIDLVPARANTLWQARHNTYLKTDITEQIRHIRSSGRLNEIRALKIWRRRHALRFPSFLLELAVLRALPRSGRISESFLTLLDYLALTFSTARLVDPVNPINIVSDLLTETEISRIAQTAAHSLQASKWPEIL